MKKNILCLFILVFLDSCYLYSDSDNEKNKTNSRVNPTPASTSITQENNGIVIVNYANIFEFNKKYLEIGNNYENVIKMFFDSIFAYIEPKTRDKGVAMIRLLTAQSDWSISPVNKDFLEKLNNMPNIFRSYAKGTLIKDDYKMDINNYDLDIAKIEQEKENRFRVFLKSSGADNPRPITVIKNKSGLWEIYEFSSIYLDVKLENN